MLSVHYLKILCYNKYQKIKGDEQFNPKLLLNTLWKTCPGCLLSKINPGFKKNSHDLFV